MGKLVREITVAAQPVGVSWTNDFLMILRGLE